MNVAIEKISSGMLLLGSFHGDTSECCLLVSKKKGRRKWSLEAKNTEFSM